MSERFAERYRCRARNRSGGRCGRAAIPGGFVCRSHGGGAPQVRAKAAERLQMRAASAAVQRLMVERERLRREQGPRVSPWLAIADQLDGGGAPK